MLLSYPLYRAVRRIATAAFFVLAVAPAAGQSVRSNSVIHPLQKWVDQIATHVPGQRDTAAIQHAGLRPSDQTLLLKVAAPFAYYLGRMDQISEPPKVSLSPSEKTLITALANKILSTQTFAEWLQRAVIFETDVAVLAPELTAAVMKGARGPDVAEAIHAEDGEAEGKELLNWHWKFARHLIDQRDPAASDRFAASWYHAVALYQLDRQHLAEMAPHVEQGFLLFPGDARIRFDRACLSDSFSSSRVQSVLTGNLPIGFRPRVPNQRDAELAAAAEFARALELDLKVAEPRVRLARLYVQQDRHADALALLGTAFKLPMGDEIAYMAHLISARANAALSRNEAAAADLRLALKLFPTSQSPLVALTQLALESGDMEGAVAAATRLRMNPARDDRNDPWWSYFQASWLDHENLFNQLRAEVRR